MKSYLRYRLLVILTLTMAIPSLGDSIDRHKDRLAAVANESETKVVRKCPCHGAQTNAGNQKSRTQPWISRGNRELRDR